MCECVWIWPQLPLWWEGEMKKCNRGEKGKEKNYVWETGTVRLREPAGIKPHDSVWTRGDGLVRLFLPVLGVSVKPAGQIRAWQQFVPWSWFGTCYLVDLIGCERRAEPFKLKRCTALHQRVRACSASDDRFCHCTTWVSGNGGTDHTARSRILPIAVMVTAL